MTPREALQHPNVAAMLRVIRQGESSQDDSAYTVINGGTHFTAPPWLHPWHGIPTTHGAKASGAYQFLGTTWANVAQQQSLPDFSPPNQDLGAVALIAGRGALDDVIAGRIPEALVKLRPEWTSLPGAAENGGRYSLTDALAVYAKYGGKLERPIEQPRVVQAPKAPMPPLIAALAPMVIQAIPQIAKLFMPAPTTEVAARNQAAAQIALDTIASATGSVNWQEGVQKITDDPAHREAATKAVLSQPEIMAIMEVGGGVAEARKADLAVMQSDKPFWKASPVFWISVLLLPIVYWLVGSLVVGGLVEKLAQANVFLPTWAIVLLGMFGGGWTGEARSGGFNLVVGLILGGICGVYYGVSVTQGKTATTNQQP
jgi:muramidase (phage lysozyme)